MFKNKDDVRERVYAALKSNNPEDYADAMANLFTEMENDFKNDIAAYKVTKDSEILAKRGVKVLTSEEKDYFNAVIKAVRENKPFNAVTGLEKGVPTTILEDVVNEINTEFPLLDEVDTKVAGLSTKLLFVSSAGAKATWGPIGDSVKKEIEGAVEAVDISNTKLSAYIPVSMDMCLEGPEWVAAFATAYLAESIGLGLEDGVVNGSGLNCPVGMTRTTKTFQSESGYAEKSATPITSFAPESYGALAAKVAVNSKTKRQRKFQYLILVCNQADYLSKVMPATTVLTANGVYARDMFPLPTKVVISDAVASGKAILGAPKAYKLALGTGGRNGRMETSDDVKFLDDARVYKQVVYANGKPEAMDEDAFQLLDISGLKPLAINAATGVAAAGATE